MSHKANHALSDLPASACTSSGFRVLFHLCDAHNSLRDFEDACFPSQARLMERTGLSNGGLNKALNKLEDEGLIRRIRGRMDNGQRSQTRYILWFDSPSPQCGVSENHLHSGSEPSPLQAQNHLHPSGEESVSITTKVTGKLLLDDKDTKSKFRLVDDWRPDDKMTLYAKSKELNEEEIERIADDFFAYWDDQPKSKSTKSTNGWQATWRNRVDAVAWRFIKNRQPTNHSGGKSRSHVIADAVHQAGLRGFD